MNVKEEILKALSYVEDPDLKKDLVTLNMIQNLNVNDKEVSFDLVLTTPACPMKDMLANACKNAIATMVDAEMVVKMNITSSVTSVREDSALLTGIKNIIAVASGKGGVGKSTVAINLAKALKSTGATVGILDADIHGPSIPVLMGAKDKKPELIGERMQPITHDGIKLMSIGFLVPKEQAIVWRGPMLSSALKQFSNDVDWGELDYLIIDLPPGTGDVHLSLVQLIPLTGMVIVTTPDEVAVSDARKAIAMFLNPQLKQEIFGVIENMSYFQPKEEKYYLFGQGGGKGLAEEFNMDLLGEIPIIEKHSLKENNSVYLTIASKVAQKVAIRNAVKKKS